MNKQHWVNEKSDSLFNAILSLNTLTDARNFFRDLLTEQEILEFANRWKVARMLYEKVPYSTIEKETGMSSTTIARINKFLNGKFEGYKRMIEKTNKSVNHHTPA